MRRSLEQHPFYQHLKESSCRINDDENRLQTYPISPPPVRKTILVGGMKRMLVTLIIPSTPLVGWKMQSFVTKNGNYYPRLALSALHCFYRHRGCPWLLERTLTLNLPFHFGTETPDVLVNHTLELLRKIKITGRKKKQSVGSALWKWEEEGQ